MINYKEKLSKIKAIAFDVDGVFTDGSIIPMNDGNLLRIQNAKDGFAVRLAVLKKFPTAIITGAFSPSVKERFERIGVPDIYIRSRDKFPDFTDYCRKHSFELSEVAFMGDDIPDIPVLMKCGLPCCPADAVPEVKAVCEFISSRNGGKGAVREIIEQLLKAQGKWDFDPVSYAESTYKYDFNQH
jgi:3-deoxy-D-manno-octulosonate 8-phosphate phosphatase (KDO 8-P phosphatase)